MGSPTGPAPDRPIEITPVEITEPMWPVAADEAYIAARLRVADAERTLRDQIEAVAAARRALPPGPLVPDYVFTEASVGRPEPAGGEVHLAELFEGHRTLTIYHLMFTPGSGKACPMCSMWVDGLHGVAQHLRQRTGFAVVAKGQPEELRHWAAHRGWSGLRVLSAHGTSFAADLNAERPNGDQRPVVSVFTQEPGGVRHYYTPAANFLDGSERGIDLLSPVWNVFDLLPQGRGNWYADNAYPDRTRG